MNLFSIDIPGGAPRECIYVPALNTTDACRLFLEHRDDATAIAHPMRVFDLGRCQHERGILPRAPLSPVFVQQKNVTVSASTPLSYAENTQKLNVAIKALESVLSDQSGQVTHQCIHDVMLLACDATNDMEEYISNEELRLSSIDKLQDHRDLLLTREDLRLTQIELTLCKGELRLMLESDLNALSH